MCRFVKHYTSLDMNAGMVSAYVYAYYLADTGLKPLLSQQHIFNNINHIVCSIFITNI